VIIQAFASSPINKFLPLNLTVVLRALNMEAEVTCPEQKQSQTIASNPRKPTSKKNYRNRDNNAALEQN
jgi:hypothetical protein